MLLAKVHLKNKFLLWTFILQVVCLGMEDEIVFSFRCPFYSVTGDSKAGLNTSAVCEIWACPGQTMDVSLCAESV